ncbi:unnamed protein product [Prorocentrum cordatum]|uniref:Uncharacterized protein n=1 Tax=Prorocentrum cordatum TaxID=2364126 RepID=A0ABN9QPV8_9DINO|nr:unnamed protein product [Polarella glacialis]
MQQKGGRPSNWGLALPATTGGGQAAATKRQGKTKRRRLADRKLRLSSHSHWSWPSSRNERQPAAPEAQRGSEASAGGPPPLSEGERPAGASHHGEGTEEEPLGEEPQGANHGLRVGLGWFGGR